MSKHTRRAFLGTAAVMTVGSLVGVASANNDSEGVYHHETFENGLDDWVVDGETSAGTENNPHWDVSLTENHALESDVAVELSFDASVGHGGVWITRELDVEPGVSYRGSIRSCAYSPEVSDNELSRLRVYAGPEEPTSIADFPTERESWRLNNEIGGLVEPLHRTEGWDEFQTHWETPEFDTDTIYLAVAVESGWPTELTHPIDDIEIDLDPQ